MSRGKIMIETVLTELAKAGGTELFLSSSEKLLKKVKASKDIKRLFINTGAEKKGLYVA